MKETWRAILYGEPFPSTRMPMRTVREVLLAHAIDYAGLFPPAGLSLAAAVANYRSHQDSLDAWALGRFVIAASQLPELPPLLAGDNGRLPLTVVCNAPMEDLPGLTRFLQSAPETNLLVEAVELKLSDEPALDALLTGSGAPWSRYVEVPLAAAGKLLPEVHAQGAFAKVRTGGTTESAFPSSEALLSFLEQVVTLRVPFKATAGLHHPLRGRYPLTYERGASDAMMYGFLNLIIATAVLWSGGDTSRAHDALLERDPSSVRFEPGSLRWRDRSFGRESLAALRRNLFHGFGSCSFREPMEELALGWS